MQDSPTPDLTSIRVLIVDDDHDVRLALVDEVSERHAVYAVDSGEAALAALAANTYDVVIADLHMPGKSGIDVLAYVHAHQPAAIRILVTGHVDHRVSEALVAAGAPYRIGKPWHDELEVVMRHALADRRGAAAEAADLAAFDGALASADDPVAVSQLAVAAIAKIPGVTSCAAVAADHLIAGELGRGGAWTSELAIDAASDLRICARGEGVGPRELTALLGHRAQRRCAELVARGAIGPTPARPLGTGRNELLRRAAIGSMTSALLHDLASSIQGLQSTVEVLCELAGDAPELVQAARDVSAASQPTVAMFLAMRKFLRSGELPLRASPVAGIIERALRVCRNQRADVAIQLGELVTHDVMVADLLFERALIHVIQRAVAASPSGTSVEIRAVDGDSEVAFTVTSDDEPDRLGEDLLREPLEAASANPGIGLAVAAHLARLHGGVLSCARTATGRRIFTLTAPRAAARA